MIQDILDYQGNIIGTMTLPDDTTDAEWTAALAVYAQPPMIPTIPDVTPRQMRQALVLSGVNLSSIDAAIATLPQPAQSLTQIEWDYSLAFERNNPLVAQIGVMLGWTSAQLDALWLFAGTL